MKRMVVLAAALGGCNVTSEDSSTQEPRCGTTAPVLEQVVVSDAGTLKIGGQDRRGVQLATRVTDADGDLWRYRAIVWFDTIVDGVAPERPNTQVAVEIADPGETPDSGDGDPCRFDVVTAGAILALGPDDVPPGEQVEFFLVIEDAAGNASERAVVVAETPGL